VSRLIERFFCAKRAAGRRFFQIAEMGGELDAFEEGLIGMLTQSF
jgi:hypothetical protein